MSINYGDKIPDGSDLTTIVSYLQLLNNKVKELKTNLNTILQNEGVDTSKATRLEELINLVKLEFTNNNNEIKQIACGYYHAFILKNDGSVWSCGSNNLGQLGLGDNDNRSAFTQVTTNINNDVKQIVCGDRYTFILKNDGSIWSCGYNANGQLGLGNTNNKTTFTQVTTNINKDVKQIVCGVDYTFILKNDGSVWSCGNNDRGQLGLGADTGRTTFTKVTTNINKDVKQIVCGGYHAFILKNDGSVWSCGYNSDGQLGLGTDTIIRKTFTQVTTNINKDVKQIACGGYHAFIIKNDGSVWSCGYNEYGQLGLGGTMIRKTFTKVTTNINNDIKQIVCGKNHTYILNNDGSIWSCGSNAYGQLGLGDTIIRKTFTKVTTNINNDIKQIVCGDDLTFILKNDDSLWSCGNNANGQLGLGTDTRRTTFTKVQRGF